MKTKTKMTLIAAALISTAGMATTASAAGADEKGKCFGVNSCKGKTACATAEGSCAGTNSCKGKGWLPMTKKDCDAKKGKFEPKTK